MRQTTCDIVIPVYDQVDYTRACVESILAGTDVPFRLIIVNDASRKPETLDYLEKLQSAEPERVCLLHNARNLGYVGTVNHGLGHTTAPYVVVMNNDTLVYPGWLSEMIAVAGKDASIGIVNPQWDVSKRFRGGRDKFFNARVLPHRGEYIETDWARGCCYLTKRCVIDAIGGLDEDFAPAYYDDWDYSMRAMDAGYRCVRALGAFVFHFKNVTYAVCGAKDQINTLIHQKGAVFYKRWGKPLKLLVIDAGISGDITVKVKELLRGQNRVVVISARSLGFEHTNLKVIKVPGWAVRAAAFLVLVDDARYARVKRFHLVIDGAKAERFFASQDPALEAAVRAMKFA